MRLLGDVFREQMVKKSKTARDRIVKIFIIINAIIIFILYINFVPFFPFLGTIIPFVFVMLVWGGRQLIISRNKEFEYAITNNELDIDVIIHKSRRRKAFVGYIRDFDGFRPYGSSEFEHTFSQAQITHDYSSGLADAPRHEFITNYQNKRTHIIFEPNEEMLALFKPHLKRGTYSFGASEKGV